MTTTRTLHAIETRKCDRTPLVWPVLILSVLMAEGAVITGVVLYCRAKGWM